jgi:UDP-N-acetylmuramoyl-tripeptide--D-alanyl-D-alanine ligase
MGPNGLFIAIRGSQRDGHDFVADAFANGAIAALVNHIPANLEKHVSDGRIVVISANPDRLDHKVRRVGSEVANLSISQGGPDLPEHVLILVDRETGTMTALQDLAIWWRQSLSTPIVAIAGSVGKTTTKDLVAAVLGSQHHVLGTAGNFNNELGLPFTLLRLTSEHTIAALEIGISAIGEMVRFAEIAGPTMAVITRIDAEHLHQLNDIDTVELEEGRLVEALPADGHAFLNADDPRVARMASRTVANVVTFGEAGDAMVRATDVEVVGLEGTHFTLVYEGHHRRVRLPLIGRHFLTGALAAASVGFVAGCSWEGIVESLEQPLESPRIRAIAISPQIMVLDDTYNASPASCIAALDVLAAQPGLRIAVLGDMFELGDFEAEAHRIVGEALKGRADLLVATGSAATGISREAARNGMDQGAILHVAASQDVVPAMTSWNCLAGRSGPWTVLVKGSRGMRMERVVAMLQQAFGAASNSISSASSIAG